MALPCFDVGTGTIFANHFTHHGADAIRSYKAWINQVVFDGEKSTNGSLKHTLEEMHRALAGTGHIVLMTDSQDIGACHVHYIAELVVGKTVASMPSGWPLELLQPMAQEVLGMLSPHCERAVVAGGIRRQAEVCGAIEIVCIPKRETKKVVTRPAVVIGPDLFNPKPRVVRPEESETVTLPVPGFTRAVDSLCRVKGQPSGRYTQRLVWSKATGPVKVDIFMPRTENWGYILAIRTGPAEFSSALGTRWARLGYRSEDGMLIDREGNDVPVYEEQDMFSLLGLQWSEPDFRDIPIAAQQ